MLDAARESEKEKANPRNDYDSTFPSKAAADYNFLR